MADRSSDRRSDASVGTDRDPMRIARVVGSGTSVLVAGSLGSGKSHLLRLVSRELAQRGRSPLILRPGAPLQDVPFGAFDNCSDPRAGVVRADDQAPLEHPVVVLVDDGQTLDAASADVLARAIYRRRAVAVMGIEIPRARDGDTRAEATGVFVDLWLHGLAERIDLRELVPHDAEQLLDLFHGADRFDAVTRASIIGLADGSRILLRELAAEASAALTAGRDPLDALRDTHRHSRVGDALVAHVRELDEAQRVTLAVLRRLAAIDYADATRLLPAAVIDGLLASGLVHEDGTIRRRLHANAALAGEAERQLEPGVLDETISRAAARMLEAGGTWWSTPLSVAVAERWHRVEQQPSLADTPHALRVRVARDAAGRANDGGLPNLAIAYTTLVPGDGEEAPALALERARAESTMMRSAVPMAALDLDRLDPSSLRRYLRTHGHVVARISADELAERLGDRHAGDGATLAELDLARAEDASMRLDWPAADAAAQRAADREGIDGATMLRSLIVSALARIHDGDWSGTAGIIERMQRLVGAPSAPPSIGTRERMLALCIEMMTAQMAGLEAGSARARLRDETILAAREGCGPAIVLADLGAALVHARAGDADGALVEYEVALHRSSNIALGPAAPMIQLAIARAVCLLGRTAAARAILRRTVDASPAAAPLLTQSQLLTESCVLAAEGATDEATEFAEAACELSAAHGARLLHLRDLYQLAALGAADDVVLHRMRRIAEATDIPAARALAERATDISRGGRSMSRRSPVERLRLGAPWSTGGDGEMAVLAPGPDGAPHALLRGFAPAVHTLTGAAASSALGLTRREREITDLVADGLSNREIAERLFLSVRTVESHVYQARTKVGARSRSELARLVVRRPDRAGDGTNGQR